MEKVMQLIRIGRKIALYLPESFEWLILNAGIFDDSELKAILNDPSEYVDSKEFFSWERFFTDLLVKKSHGTYLQYNKRSLNKAISFFVFKFKCSLYNDILFKIFRANKKGSYYTSMKLADSCLLLCPLDKLLW